MAILEFNLSSIVGWIDESLILVPSSMIVLSCSIFIV